jgi:hypothetical protein
MLYMLYLWSYERLEHTFTYVIITVQKKRIENKYCRGERKIL